MRLFSAFLLGFLMIPPAQAAETPWASADHVQARLMTGTARDGAVPAGLEARLEEGWHAYWRMPGDGGLAPALDWEGSENLKEAVIAWPAPERFLEAGLNSFGYSKSVVLPLTLTPAEPGKPLKLILETDIMVCKDICVPQKLALQMDVPAEDDGRYDAVLEKAREKVPVKDDMPSLKIEGAVIGPEALVVRAYAQEGFEEADLFVESGELYLTAPPAIEPDAKDPRYATLRVTKPAGVDNLAKELMEVPVTLTLKSGRRAVERTFFD